MTTGRGVDLCPVEDDGLSLVSGIALLLCMRPAKVQSDQRKTCQRPLARHVREYAAQISDLVETERAESLRG